MPNPPRVSPRAKRRAGADDANQSRTDLDFFGRPGEMKTDRAVQTTKGRGDVKLPDHVWAVPAYAQESLMKLKEEYLDYLSSRPNKAAEGTLDKYGKTLVSFMKSLQRNDDPLILASLTPASANRWLREQRDAGLAEAGIASRLNALKAFSNQFIFEYLELTTVNVLAKVSRFKAPERMVALLTDGDIEQLMSAFDRKTYTDTRNQALVAVFICTGLRLKEVLSIELGDIDQVNREVRVIQKKNRERVVRISPGAWTYVKKYLKKRDEEAGSKRLWLTEDGRPMTNWAVYGMLRRVEAKTGLDLWPHLFRHTFGQQALLRGATPEQVQDMMGHDDPRMTVEYTRSVRKRLAAKSMPQYSAI